MIYIYELEILLHINVNQKIKFSNEKMITPTPFQKYVTILEYNLFLMMMSDVNIFLKVKLSPNCIYVAFDAQQLIKIQANKNCVGNF